MFLVENIIELLWKGLIYYIGKFANPDSLIDRVNFLCGVNEISHLVTDMTSLPFAKEDSAMVNDSQKVYLYGCPSVE